jgi:thioredoxin type arsenate reductase
MKRVLTILKALSDQTRLRIYMALETGPLCLAQITDILALAASTVSRHLQVLIEAGLLETRQEGRWHYFAWAGDATRPEVGTIQQWLRDLLAEDDMVRNDAAKRAVAMESFPAPGPRSAKAKVLFLCTGNSCRSQMAEALLRKHAGQRFEVYSAGIDPKPIPSMAFEVMAEIGLDIHDQRPKSVLDFLGRTHFGYLITVCSNAESRCPIFPGVSCRLYWPVDDPASAEGTKRERLAAFRETRNEIERRIIHWLAEMDGNEGIAPVFRSAQRS